MLTTPGLVEKSFGPYNTEEIELIQKAVLIIRETKGLTKESFLVLVERFFRLVEVQHLRTAHDEAE